MSITFLRALKNLFISKPFIFILIMVTLSTVSTATAHLFPSSTSVDASNPEFEQSSTAVLPSFNTNSPDTVTKAKVLVTDGFDDWTVGGGYLYWSKNCATTTRNNYALYRWPLSGGLPETLITVDQANCNTFRYLVADGDGVFFWDDAANRLMNYPTELEPGQNATVVRGSVGSVATAGLALDNNNIYFVNTSNKIRRVPKTGGENKIVQEAGSTIKRIAIDRNENDVYWIDNGGLWRGRKNCSSPPCSKGKLTSDTAHDFALGASGKRPRTVYMVQGTTKPKITGYSCENFDTGDPCIKQLWYQVTGEEIGTPAFIQSGFPIPDNWLVWSEVIADKGRLRKRKLEATYPLPSTNTRDNALSKQVSLKVFVVNGQIYYADEKSGNKVIMRVPFSGNVPPRNFDNLSQVNTPYLSEEWKPIVRVESTWNGASDNPFICTGTLIDPGIVLTAGRCLYNTSLNAYADSVRVIPSYENGAEPFGTASMQAMGVFDQFIHNGTWRYNIGWIKLDRPVGAFTNWYNIGYAADHYLWLSEFTNTGYPRSDLDIEFLYNRGGQFYKLTDDGLLHTAQNADLKGSPAINVYDNTIYGVEARFFQSKSEVVVVRLTKPKVEEINNFITNNTPTAVDLIPLQFRVPNSSGLRAGAWVSSESFTLHNYSTANTTADQTVNVNIYLSTDDQIDETDTFLASGSFQLEGPLNGRQSMTIPSVDWNGTPSIPLDTPPGTYWLGISLDEADADPSNNATHGWDAVEMQILPPIMNVEPSTLTVLKEIGDPPTTETVTIDILGDGAGNPDFDWTATPSTAWLTVNAETGNDSEEVTITIDSTGLGPGTHEGQISFETALQNGSGLPVASAVVDVTLYVEIGEPVWQPEPAVMNFEAIAGGVNPPSQDLLVKAAIDYPFNWIVADASPVSEDATWLPIDNGAGTAPAIFTVAPDISGLAPGNYSTQLATYSPDQNNYTLTTVNLTIHEVGTPQPILQVAPVTLFYEGIIGQTTPAPQTFGIDNIGTGDLSWTAVSDMSWLNLSQTSGTAGAEVSVSVSADDLSAGTHVGEVTITADTGAQQVVRAVLQLQPPPTMVVDNTLLVFNGLSGQAPPAPQNFVVRNVGAGSFNWFLTANSPWLTTTPSEGTSADTVEVVADTTNLEPGTYESSILVTSPTATDSPQEVGVRLFLRQGPVLATTPTVLDFSIEAGSTDSTPKSFNIANTGRGDMTWTAASDASWLILDQTAGTTGEFTSTTVNVNINAANLNPRDEAYTGQITVRSDNGDGSPQTITVYLYVTSPARYCNIPNGGQGYVVNSHNARIRFTNVERTLTPDGGCNFSATLRASLPQNTSLTSEVSGHVDSNNVFVPTASSPLRLQIAVLNLRLSDEFSISDEYGLRVNGGEWKLPNKFGGRSKNFGGTIEINANGLSLDGTAAFDLPNINYGAMKLTQLRGEVSISDDRNYLVQITGNMEIDIVGDGTSIEDISLRLDRKGFRSGRIGTFTVQDIAGVDLEIVSATFDNDKIRANKAILKIPQAWGGAEGAVYGLTIDFNGNLKVSGGRFKLPSIRAGGDSFNLSSLEGEFRSVSGGYEIRARGEFGMRGIGNSGGCTLIVDVTIFSDVGTSVLAIDPIDVQHTAAYTTTTNSPHEPVGTEAIDGIALREITLGVWDCQPGMPIGATGFELTGVQGTVKLRSGLEEVSLRLQIQSVAKLGTIPFLSIEPQATFRPDPFFIGYDGPTYMTNIRISETVGQFENRRFSAEMRVSFVVIHGGMGIEAGLNSGGNFYLEGNGWADVSVKKGSVFKKCALGLCLNIPPFTLNLARADVEVSLTHIAGSFTIKGYGASFKYSFRTGDLDISRASFQRMITSEEIHQMRAFQQRQVGSLPASHELITSISSETVLLTLPVEPTESQKGQLDPAAAELATAVQSDALFVLLQPTDGELSFVLIDPSGEEYTPANLPTHIQFEQAQIDGTQQIVYSVAHAQLGAWQTRVEGDIDNTDFVVFETLNTVPSAFDNLALTPTGTLNEIEVQWQHVAQEATPQITLYANSGDIVQTLTYTNSQGVVVTGVTDHFTGEPVAEFDNPATNGQLETVLIDLSQLPSGDYAFWIEAEGIETANVRCYIRLNGSGCAESAGEVARFNVDHSTTFPSRWDPSLAADVVIKDGRLTASWEATAHPNVTHYLLTVAAEGVLRANQTTVTTINVPPVYDQSERMSVSVDNIVPGVTYYLNVTAVDEDSNRSVQSPELTITTPQPDFYLAAPETTIVVGAGGMTQTTSFRVEMSSDLLYDPLLFVDYEQLPDGIDVVLGAEVASAVQSVEAVQVELSATAGMPLGHYVIPIVGRSGELERTLTLSVEVTAPHYNIHLPWIMHNNLFWEAFPNTSSQ